MGNSSAKFSDDRVGGKKNFYKMFRSPLEAAQLSDVDGMLIVERLYNAGIHAPSSKELQRVLAKLFLTYRQEETKDGHPFLSLLSPYSAVVIVQNLFADRKAQSCSAGTGFGGRRLDELFKNGCQFIIRNGDANIAYTDLLQGGTVLIANLLAGDTNHIFREAELYGIGQKVAQDLDNLFMIAKYRDLLFTIIYLKSESFFSSQGSQIVYHLLDPGKQVVSAHHILHFPSFQLGEIKKIVE